MTLTTHAWFYPPTHPPGLHSVEADTRWIDFTRVSAGNKLWLWECGCEWGEVGGKVNLFECNKNAPRGLAFVSPSLFEPATPPKQFGLKGFQRRRFVWVLCEFLAGGAQWENQGTVLPRMRSVQFWSNSPVDSCKCTCSFPTTLEISKISSKK